MRTSLMGGAFALLTVVGTATAAAQDAGSWGFTIGGGVTAPIRDRTEIIETGFHGIGSVGYRPAGSLAEWALELGYHRLSNKLVDGENNHILTVMARVNYDVGTSAYLIGAAGMFRNEYTEPRVEPVITNTRTAIAISAGAGLALGSRLFGEARLLHAFTDGGSTTLVPVTLGVRF